MGVWTPGPGPTVGNDTFMGDNSNEVASGGDGDDTLNGGGGNDTLNGDNGDDTLDGGDGADTIHGGDGNDTIVGQGGGVDTLYGDAGNDSLTGGEAADILDGGTGADSMNGWNGDDTYYVDNVGDTITDNSGIDTVYASVSYSLATNDADNIYLTGAALNGTGNTLANIIVGNDNNNLITGGDGDDTLTGGIGDDTFIYAAGAGADTITDFDADAAGGQDLLDITAFGITTGDFGARVTIADMGAYTLVTIDGTVTISLTGVDGDNDNVITQADFILS